jgi:hypothetical protein
VDVFDLAQRQHAAFTRDQARALGLTDHRIAGLVRLGVVDRAAPTVYVVRGHPPTWRQRLLVGALSLPGSMASHRAASWLHGLDGISTAPLELVVERGRHRREAPRGVVLHERRDLRGIDLDEVDGIPCTSLVRTLVDLPAVVHPFRAGMALDHALRRTPGLLPQLVDRHTQLARRGRNGTVAMRALLAERSDGRTVDSGFERRALRLIDGSDLPRPVTQHHVVDGDFQCWLDIAWPDRQVAMECDSLAHHLGERAFRWERVRRRRLIALGWTVLEFTYREVTEQGPMVIRELRRHLVP